MSPVKQATVKEQIAGIIEISHSSWSSPVVLVPKKDGGHRLCIDYRKLNALTESDAYPLPNISEILESIAGSIIFLAGIGTYWHGAMAPESKEKTSFITPIPLQHHVFWS